MRYTLNPMTIRHSPLAKKIAAGAAFLTDGPLGRAAPFFWGLVLVGIALRLGFVFSSWDAVHHPDLYSFHPRHLSFQHPFDTAPREPLFVWWLWLLSKLGLDFTGAIRAVTSLWFIPNILLLFSFARPLAGLGPALGAAALYALVPAQIQSDTLGLRHLIETAGLLFLSRTLVRAPGLSFRRAFALTAAALAMLVLTRLTYASSGGLLIILAAWRARKPGLILAGIPAALLLSLHMLNNQKHFQDPFYVVNQHSYWCANYEYLGRPGFPATHAEREKDVYRKSLNYRQWVAAHTPAEFVRDTLIGYRRFIYDFFESVYFRLNLPRAATAALLILHFWGLIWGLAAGRMRLMALSLVIWIYPFAFAGHVFWAGRFFVPFTPFTLLLLSAATASLLKKGRAFLRARPSL
jgi:hypothetical protein